MTKLSWGTVGERFYETGTDHGVLYLDGIGVAWNGLISVTESPSGGDPTPYYLDGVKYLNHSNPEEFEATIEAYTYPDEFMACDGSSQLANGLRITQQRRKSFGMVYRTKIGNDLDGADHAYKLHVIYNAMATPSSSNYKTTSDSPDLLTFSWKIGTKPQKFDDLAFGTMYGSHLVIDSRVTYPWAMEAVENVLFGTDTMAATLPNPTDLLKLFVDNALLKVIDNGDGTWTATGPDEAFAFVQHPAAITVDPADEGMFTISEADMIEDPTDPGTFTHPMYGLVEDTSDPGTYLDDPLEEFQITWPSAIPIDTNSYTLSSL